MKFTSLFAGIGGFDLGLERAGMSCTLQVELNPQCRHVLKQHFPNARRQKDVSKTKGKSLRTRLVAGGFPCQDLSVAGKRTGLAGKRSGLFFQFTRILAEARPRWCVVENVPGLLSSNGGRDMGIVLGALGQLGYGWAYRVLDAQHFGVAQRRKRVFIVGCLGSRTGAARVLFEPESLSGDPPTRPEAGQGTAAGPAAGTASGPGIDRPGRKQEDGIKVVASLRSNYQCDHVGDESKLVVQNLYGDDKTPPLMARSSRGGATPLSAGYQTDGLMIAQPSAFNIHGIGSNAKNTHARKTDTARTLDGFGPDCGQGGTVLVDQTVTHSLRGEGFDGSEDGTGRGIPLVPYRLRPRRLTPTECLRLQAFPDDWLDLDPPLSDSHKYRMTGNAVCTTVAYWLGCRIMEVEAGRDPNALRIDLAGYIHSLNAGKC